MDSDPFFNEGSFSDKNVQSWFIIFGNGIPYSYICKLSFVYGVTKAVNFALFGINIISLQFLI